MDMMLKVNNKIFLGWTEVEGLINTICHVIERDYPYIESVHGIKRGGLIPSVMISHKLNLPWTHEIFPNTLVVDDICDSGETLANYAGVYTAVLFYKPHTSTFKPNIYARIHKGDEWLIYPWESIKSNPIQDYKL
jgi:hypoxanthine phosphoribosyltransferase